MQKLVFVDLILPLSIGQTFTYHTTQEVANSLTTGMRVVVPFGSGKLYTAIVHQLHHNQPQQYKTKNIYAVLDSAPLLLQQQIQFWEWIASYYFCSLGDVYRNVFPAALKIESESYLVLNKQNQPITSISELGTKEQLLYEALILKQIISVKEAAKVLDEQSAIPTIKKLYDAGLVMMQEKVKEKYQPKIQKYIQVPNHVLSQPTQLQHALESLTKAPKQRMLFMQLLQTQNQSKSPIQLSDFLKNHQHSHATAKSLAEKKWVKIYDNQTDRVVSVGAESQPIMTLSKQQQTALESIKSQLTQQNVVVLHGVTSSGKTEVYIHLIQQTIKQGKRVLYLLPEISLSNQLLVRLQRYFGKKVGVYHSKYNQNERVELWQNTLNNQYDIVIGVRSALFVPLQNIGLVIVDEAHESSLKQQNQKPFYNTRDAAIYWANLNQAKTLIGTATPSLESFYNVQQQKYGLTKLNERYGGVKPPAIELIDLKIAHQKKEITGNITHQLKKAIEECLISKKQTIIFQNRRGYAPVVECLSCGYTAACPNCDVSLTYHQYNRQLKCHYCGHKEHKPIKCPSCFSPNLDLKGIGTEQIATELKEMFPNANIARMDTESMRRKHAYEKIIEKLENQEIDILVGTQMLAKGLDFEHLQLVGVVRADSMLNYPDFRATEKAYQLLTQVAGRAGRRQEQGKVLIQTYNPQNPVLQNVKNYDYTNNATQLLADRKKFNYPPFVRLILINFTHHNKEKCTKAANELAKSLQPYFLPQHLLGPESPPIERINNKYHKNILIKIPPNQSPKKIKTILQKQLDLLNTIAAFRAVRTKIDIDP